MKKYILIIMAVWSLISCEKDLKFDDEGLANQLVLNSILSSKKDFSASLTKTQSILKNSYGGGGPIADGTIDIYENGLLITNVDSPTGYFKTTSVKPKAGNTYRIVVNSNGKTLEAETTIPKKTEVISIDTMIVKEQFLNPRLQVNVKIKDVAGDNYYRITVNQESLVLQMNVDGKGTQKYFLSTIENWISSDNPVFKSVYNNFGGDAFETGPNNDYNIFPDDYFKGKEYTIQFFINNYSYGNLSSPGGYGGNQTTKTIYKRNIVHVQHLSKEMYTYLKYLKLYSHYQGNPFSEPVPVFSNIKNGIGIFAGLNDDAQFTFEKIYRPFSMDTITIEKSYSGGGYYYGSNGGN